METIGNSTQSLDALLSFKMRRTRSPPPIPLDLLLKKQIQEQKEQEHHHAKIPQQQRKYQPRHSVLKSENEVEEKEDGNLLLDLSSPIESRPSNVNDNAAGNDFLDSVGNSNDLLNMDVILDFNFLDDPLSPSSGPSIPSTVSQEAQDDNQSLLDLDNIVGVHSANSFSNNDTSIPIEATPENGQLVRDEKEMVLPVVHQHQSGVFRVNCIDCCDRTNVVQTYIARTILLQQLSALDILKSATEVFPRSFQDIFNHVWANNGDRVSLLYSGTHALMGDYTRTGVRSVSGLLNDGVNSISRYLQNNFKDSEKQRSINLILGLLDLDSKEERTAAHRTGAVSELLLF